MDAVIDLVEALRRNLWDSGYCRMDEGVIGGVDYAAVLATARRAPPKFVCAVARVPEAVRDYKGAGRFAGGIRKGLAKRYVGFPWLNRLGTYTVLLASREVFDELTGREGQFIDQGGLHVNVMLGTVLVDVDTFRTRSDHTWELLGDGEEFRSIQSAVESWCTQRRRPNRQVWSNHRAVSVA
jgi:hypothetical protein